MRMLRIDIDRPGTSKRLRVGPLAPGLNAIIGDRGAGKSTLLFWLRRIIRHAENRDGSLQSRREDRRAFLAGHPNLAGQVEMTNAADDYRITTDRNGRICFDRFFDTEDAQTWDARTQDQRSWEHLSPTNLSAAQRLAFDGLAVASLSENTQSALESLASQLGMDSKQEVPVYAERLALRKRELGDLLLRWNAPSLSMTELVRLRGQLDDELLRVREVSQLHPRYEDDEWRDQWEYELRSCQNELATLDEKITSLRQNLDVQRRPEEVTQVDGSLLSQLQQIDDRLHSWRQTLCDLREHRGFVEQEAAETQLDQDVGEQIVGARMADPRVAMRSLEALIAKTRQQWDRLVEQYGVIPETVAELDAREKDFAAQDAKKSSKTQSGILRYQSALLPVASSLPQTLHNMEAYLHEICQQISRQQVNVLSLSLRQQIGQLERCEAELDRAIVDLVGRRDQLLRCIADDHHLSLEQLNLAYGQWCKCDDHPHLMDWLLTASSASVANRPKNSLPSPGMERELEQLKTRRKATIARAEECQRRLREGERDRRERDAALAGRSTRTIAELQSQRDRVVDDIESRERQQQWQMELERVRHELNTTRPHASLFWCQVYENIDGLLGRTVRRDYAAEYQKSLPASGPIRELATRLAIAQGMMKSGQSISLWLDDLLDGISRDNQLTAVRYLANASRGGQQIVILSSDSGIADLVLREGGNVDHMHSLRLDVSDPNQRLAAYANDHESDKWYDPAIVPSKRWVASKEYYLYDESPIDDLPAIDRDVAARCRRVGIYRIADLINADPSWLAGEIQLRDVDRSAVVDWQDVSQLCCQVRRLRPFDARILVGAGIRTAHRLASIDPSTLSGHIEAFLETEHGQRILRGGSSSEIARLSSWIASARRSASSRYVARDSLDREYAQSASRRHARTARDASTRRLGRNDRRSNTPTLRGELDRGYDTDRYETGLNRAFDGERSGETVYGIVARSGDRQPRQFKNGGERAHRQRTDREPTNRQRTNRETDDRQRTERTTPDRLQREETLTRENTVTDQQAPTAEKEWKFYLELDSPVVDAPSIGPRMADRLAEAGIETVAELLAADPQELAQQLDYRRADAERIAAWQSQASLVCRIPNLRGHDAQLLVACELTTPDALIERSPEDVLELVTVVVESKEGQRILRGSSEPDLQEVTDWLAWASANRQLNAA